MTITRRHQSYESTIRKGDTLAEHAVAAYSHVLNQPGYHNRTFTGPEFAAEIEKQYGGEGAHPVNLAVINHLKHNA